LTVVSYYIIMHDNGKVVYILEELMKKKLLAVILTLITVSALSAKSNKPIKLNWNDGGPRYVTYMTITGKTGFITTPSAYCAPMGTLMLGYEHTFSSRWNVWGSILKATFTPHSIVEFGFSKKLAYMDGPNSPTHFQFDSTPFFLHYKVRFLDWGNGAVAFGQDFDLVPDNSGSPSRGGMSTTIYFVFTGVSTLAGSFNFGIGKTFYLTRMPDSNINFFASWVYSFAQLDDRLQLCLDFSNADFAAGNGTYRVSNEDRAYLNAQVRGVLIKTPRFQWTMMFALYDVLDIGFSGFHASLGTTFNIDLY
jgi:hypothetical protein